MACLEDTEARLSLENSNPFALQTKPHGHGDVHALLHESGLAKKWKAAGVQWVCFFQDTNGLVFRGLPAALGKLQQALMQLLDSFFLLMHEGFSVSSMQALL